MKVLVVGRGWTGKKVFAELQSRNIDAELVSSANAFQTVDNGNYNWVVNCAGVTGSPNVDACESDEINTMAGNAVFPVLLQRRVAKKARFMHWSSGCIYQGAIDSVDATPNFFGSIYSISKGLSDTYLKNNSVVLRIRMPFSSVLEDKNLISKIANYASAGKLYDTGNNSMTDHDEAVKISVDMLTENIDDGPYNLVNAGTLNMHEIAQIMNLNVVWRTEEEFKASIRCERSTCVIPADSRMRSLDLAFREAVAKCYS